MLVYIVNNLISSYIVGLLICSFIKSVFSLANGAIKPVRDSQFKQLGSCFKDLGPRYSLLVDERSLLPINKTLT